MRKTLTAILIVLAAGSLAACKMFWEKDETPEPTKPANQTAATDPAKPVGPEVPGKPATK